MPVVLSRQ